MKEIHNKINLASNLLFQMLNPIPKKRISVKECLEHLYFNPEMHEKSEADFDLDMLENSVMNQSKTMHMYFFFNFEVLF